MEEEVPEIARNHISSSTSVSGSTEIVRKWPTSEELMEKKLFVSVTENSEEVTVQQETAKNASQASVWFDVGD
ncbi:hypothetical protein JOQ06_002502 [Pogonophryne albipinna]|uniref:Uncharacterized protein n=1 Tax=Pogonophryne albipinna TaxID=1090488 RepID=A0AAD6B934_9TELE|nr:hypothetical protein JOQ06_002502 [Pogonophryne albipinna]